MSTPSAAWLDHFPGLGRLPDDLRTTLVTHSTVIELPAGSQIYGPGHAPNSFLLLLHGTVRVQQVSEGGREIVLYRVSGGESCALTTACLMSYEDYPAEAVAETEIGAVAIPRATFDDMIARSAVFRQFVFAAFGARITNLMHIIDEIAFLRMDIRLAHKLLELANEHDSVQVTQQRLAAELGSAREVISRMLSEFQRRGWVTSARGSIAILNRPALEKLAHEH